MRNPGAVLAPWPSTSAGSRGWSGVIAAVGDVERELPWGLKERGRGTGSRCAGSAGNQRSAVARTAGAAVLTLG